MDIFHPIVIHLPIILWTIALTLSFQATHPGPDRAADSPLPNASIFQAAVLVAGMSSLTALITGLIDEDNARDHLVRAWFLDDHRGAGIAVTCLSLLFIASHLKKLSQPPKAMTKMLLALIAIAHWFVALLGHNTIRISPWQ